MSGLARREILTGIGAAALLPLAGPLIAAPLARVKDLGVLRIAVYKDNRPWSWRSNGALTGIDVDIATAIAEVLGVRADIAELMADESADDDLRNGVWKGGRLGFQPADLMLHIPFDRAFAARNDQVAIIAPYYRESFTLACDSREADCEAPPVRYRGKRLAAELDSIPDFYLLGSFGGILANDVVHYTGGTDAVEALVSGKADVALASRAQIETVLATANAPYVKTRHAPLPAMLSPGWDIGMAVKENSRTLGDAIEDCMAAMAKSGRLASIFQRHGVSYEPALSAG